MLLAAAARGRPAIDAVYVNIPDLDGLAAEAEDAAASGFTLKACIHPSQVAVVRKAFQADEAQVAWARRVLAAARAPRARQGRDQGRRPDDRRPVDPPGRGDPRLGPLARSERCGTGEGTHTFWMIDLDLLRHIDPAYRGVSVALIRRGIHFGSYGSVDDGAAVFGRLAEAARAAEEAGFDAISVPDHVHQNRVGGGPASPMFEAYTVLGALALGHVVGDAVLAGQPGYLAGTRAARQGGDHARRDLRRAGRARRRRGLGRRRARGLRDRLPRARRAVRPA